MCSRFLFKNIIFHIFINKSIFFKKNISKKKPNDFLFFTPILKNTIYIYKKNIFNVTKKFLEIILIINSIKKIKNS